MNGAVRQRSRRRWIVKIGSALLTRDGEGLDHAAVTDWTDQILALRTRCIDVVMVSSGSIALGMRRLGLARRPEALYELQALAAVGQMGLIQLYESCFQRGNVHAAQVLLTHEDFADRKRYLNAKSTLRSLLDYEVVPVINENDTVSTDEIRVGDNDSLAGMVANLVQADLMVLLTDQRGLCSAAPRTAPDAELIEEGWAGDPELRKLAGGGGALGRGGMVTKLEAAGLAARSGTHTRIVNGREERVLERLADGEFIGTLLKPPHAPVAARKQWLAGQRRVHGQLQIDSGAARVLREQGRSLLAVGVRGVTGSFDRGEIVSCVTDEGVEVARGLANYSAAEVARIMGQPSERIRAILGYVDEPELIHRDNLVVVG